MGWIAGVVGAVAGAAGDYGQQALESKEEEASKMLNNKVALDNLLQSVRANEVMTDQINQQSASISIESQKAAAQAKGAAAANAGASGTGGGVVEMQNTDIKQSTARQLAVSTLNKKNALEKVEQNEQSAARTFTNNLNLLPTQKPDVVQSIFAGIGTGMSMYGAG